MNKDSKLKILIKILMAFSVLFALIFIFRNLNYVPGYGDTPEFLDLAQNFKLDGYRKFVFPLILRLSMNIASFFNISYTYILYLIQNVVSLIACFVFMRALKNIFEIEITKKEYILYSLFFWSIPFNIHFNMAVLSDSLAISLTLLFLGNLMYFVKNKKLRYAFLSLLFMYLAANARSEKIYFCIFVLLFTVLGIIIIKKKIKNKVALILLIVMILGTVLNIGTEKILQKMTANNEGGIDRTQPGFISFLSQRIMQNDLEQMYQYFPEEITRTISYDDVVNNGKAYYEGIYEKLTNEDNNNYRVILLLKTILKHNWYNILLDTSSDFIKNIFPTIYQFFEVRDGAFQWTITRMQGEHPVYTTCYIVYYDILYLLILLLIAIKLVKNNYKYSKNKIMCLIPILSYILASALFFSCLTIQNFHIRYVMPSYMIEIGLTIIIYTRTYNKNEMEEKKK